jgi:oxygen-dependent protoporphyrinogen oxidase
MGPEKCDVVVIGAGISGLCTAHWLAALGIEVRILEKEAEVGGTMKTVHEDGFLIEQGPDSGQETTPLIRELVQGLRLESQFLHADPWGRSRYVLWHGRLHKLPMSPAAFLASPLLSLRAKFHLLSEPFVGRVNTDESVSAFVLRRLGREFLDSIMDPLAADEYASSPELLSVRWAYPELAGLEERYGGLLRGMLRERSGRKRPAEMFSFRDGMQVLPRAVADALRRRVVTGAKVTALRDLMRDPAAETGEPDLRRYEVEYLQWGAARQVEADSIVLAVPAFAAAPLIAPYSSALSHALNQIKYPPLASVFLGFASHQIRRPLDGSGFLIPSSEKAQILSCRLPCRLFPGRAPHGHTAVTAFVGGSRQPELTQKDDAELVLMVTQELRPVMQIEGNPVYSRVTRWQRAIPQFAPGHDGTLDALAAFEDGHPGIWFCSSYREGISIGDCIKSARETARRVTAELMSVRGQ